MTKYCEQCKLKTMHIDDVCDVCKGEPEDQTMPSASNRAVVCPVCDGRGKRIEAITKHEGDERLGKPYLSISCHGCGGKGWIEVGNNIKITQTLSVRSGDVVVMEHSGNLSECAQNGIIRQTQRIFGDGTKVLILEEGMKIPTVLRYEDIEEPTITACNPTCTAVQTEGGE